MKRPKTSDKLALRIARAKLRAIKEFTRGTAILTASDGEPPFIQICAVQRGGGSFIHGLDSHGQIWAQRWRKATDTAPEESWWEPISMERRKKEEPAP